MTLNRWIVPMMMVLVAAAGVAGCSSSPKENATDKALNDPFNYGPSATSEWPDVSGGGIHQLDKKGLKRDLDHVFNP